MKKIKKTKSPKTAASSARDGWALVNEPDHPSCKPKVKWRVRYRHVELTDHYQIEIRFRSRNGKRDTIIVSARDRSEFEKIRRELSARDARIPEDRKAGQEFVEALIRATPKQAVAVVSKPGFRDGATGFAMPTRMYGTAKGRFVWDEDFADPSFGEVMGSLAEYREGVLEPALRSPYLSFVILTSLASPLPSYVEQKDGRGKLLSEGVIFHIATGQRGKTLCARLSQSVYGSPEALLDYEATKRGVAEACYTRNNLVPVFDDGNGGAGRKDVFLAMKLLGERVSCGCSKAIARTAAKGGFPAMTWSVIGLSRDRKTDRDWGAAEQEVTWSARSFCRFACARDCSRRDFRSRAWRGPMGAKDPGKLIDKLKSTVSLHHGVLMDAWISFLLSGDQSKRIRQAVDDFVETTAGGESGLEARFARKFGVVYAAGLLRSKLGCFLGRRSGSRRWSAFATTLRAILATPMHARSRKG